MKTTVLSDNLIMLTRRNLVLPNAYLVREDDGFTLIDTTTRGAADKLVAAASRAGAKIRRVALTHGHGDHVGSLDALRERLGEEVEVLIPELEARIQTGEQVVEGKLPGSWPKVTTRPDVVLQDGDWVGSLRVVACPGHSPGHVAFLDTRDRSVIAGDVFTSIGSVQVTNHFYLRFPLLSPRWRPGIRQRTSSPLRTSRDLRRTPRNRRRSRARSAAPRAGDGGLPATCQRSHTGRESRRITDGQPLPVGAVRQRIA